MTISWSSGMAIPYRMGVDANQATSPLAVVLILETADISTH